jgi:hypothetical protein
MQISPMSRPVSMPPRAETPASTSNCPSVPRLAVTPNAALSATIESRSRAARAFTLRPGWLMMLFCIPPHP